MTDTAATPDVTVAPEATLPKCRLCGHEAHWLGDHLVEAHNLDVQAYLTAYPGAPTISAEALDLLKKETARNTRRMGVPVDDALTLSLYDFELPVNSDVPASACLPLPGCWRWVENGDLKLDFVEMMIAFLSGRHIYIWGLQGASKDSSVQALCAMLRRPSKMFQISPDADVQAWMFSHEFKGEDTYYKEGELLKAIRDGFTCPNTGKVIPYVILLTDLDRATKNQIEALRLILDSVEGRVMGPNGILYPVLPGTQFIATGNTAGSGDERGRYTSSNIIDASMMDRFQVKLQFHWMEWEDEGPIVKAKFPLLHQRCPEMFDQVGNACRSLRDAITKNTLYAEFSHRAVCSWLGHAEDVIRWTKTVPKDLAERSLRVWLDGLGDEATRISASRLISVHIQDGVIGRSVSGQADSAALGGF